MGSGFKTIHQTKDSFLSKHRTLNSSKVCSNVKLNWSAMSLLPIMTFHDLWSTCTFLQFNLGLMVICLSIIWRFFENWMCSIFFVVWHTSGTRKETRIKPPSRPVSFVRSELTNTYHWFSSTPRIKADGDHFRPRLESRAKRASCCWFRSCREN